MPAKTRLDAASVILALLLISSFAAPAYSEQYAKRNCSSDSECVAKAKRLAQKKQFHDAAEYYITALSYLQGRKDMGKFLFITSRLGLVFESSGDLANAEKAFTKILTVCRKGKCDKRISALANFKIAQIYSRTKRPCDAEPYYEKAIPLIIETAGPDSKLLCEAYENAGLNYLNQGKPDKAEPLLIKLVALSEKLFGPDHLNTASCYNNLANAYGSQHYYADAASLHAKALNIKKKKRPGNHPDTLTSYLNIAICYNAQNKLKEAENILDGVLGALKKAKMMDSPIAARTFRIYANNLNRQGRFDEADKLIELSRQLYVKQGASTHSEMGRLHQARANGLFERGRLDEAAEQYEKALDIFNRHFGKDSVSSLQLYMDLGRFYSRIGEFSKAKFYTIKAIETLLNFKNVYGESMAALLRRLAEICIRDGQPDNALGYYQSALRILEARGRNCDADMALTCQGIAKLYQATGKNDLAQQYLERALALNIAAYGEAHPTVAGSYCELGDFFDGTEQYDKAEEAFATYTRIQAKALGEGDNKVGDSLFRYGAFLLDRHEAEKCLAPLERALAIFQSNGKENSGPGAGVNLFIGQAYLELGKIGPAVNHGKRSLEILKKMPGKFQVEKADTLEFLADVHERSGDYREAAQYQLDAIDILKEKTGEESARVGKGYNKLGIIRVAASRFAEAEENFQVALKILSKAYGPLHPQPATVYQNMGAMYVTWGQLDKAEGMYLVALTNYTMAFGEKGALVGQTLWALADVVHQRGRPKDALTLARKALLILEATYGPDAPQTAKGRRLVDAINDTLSQTAI